MGFIMDLWIKRIIFCALLIVVAGAWGLVGSLAGISQVFITVGLVVLVGGGVVNYWPK